MAAPAIPVNPLTQSIGFNIRIVQVTQVDLSQNLALAVDQQNVQVGLPMNVMRAKGLLPAEGEIWMIDQSLGFWSFAAQIRTSVQGYTLQVDTPHALELQNGWVNTAAPSDPVSSYWLLPDGDVRVTGNIKNGTSAAGTVLATLPEGYRPRYNHSFPVYINKLPAAGSDVPNITVLPSGDVQLFGSSGLGSTGQVIFNFTLPMSA